MSECTKDLQAKGVPCPRTCAICSLGPCSRYTTPAEVPKPAPTFEEELRALETMTRALDSVDDNARVRMITYAICRFNVTLR